MLNFDGKEILCVTTCIGIVTGGPLSPVVCSHVEEFLHWELKICVKINFPSVSLLSSLSVWRMDRRERLLDNLLSCFRFLKCKSLERLT